MAKKNQRHVVPDLLEKLVDPDPILQFQQWFRTAYEAEIPHAEAMTLATVSAEGEPSARVVLMKRVDERGFLFFTNYESRKGEELIANPAAALLFYWEILGRQVRVEGTVEKITAEESDAYFASRPRENQLSSLASPQSRPVEREALDRKFEKYAKTYAEKTVPRPAHWGGYRLKPARIEFWQRRFARLNDRILYERSAGGMWTMKRLAP
ncbi:MAG: pyridoxamine 5'-phosphate oxidase [Bacteroidota bacterium]